jgi:hypothetical protein
MSYILNKTDGSILTELIDGVLDQDTTDVALVGRNYRGYGEYVNENLIKLLENFANVVMPVSPLRGQLWYDTSINKLKVYNGLGFVTASGSAVSGSQPLTPTAGDTWFNTSEERLYLYDGTKFKLVGPQYTVQQGESGLLVATIQDTNLNSRTVLKLVIGQTLQAVISREEFIPNDVLGNTIPQLVTAENPTGAIKVGINVLDPDNFVFRGTALRTERVITASGSEILADQILRNDQDGVLLGSLGIRSTAGIVIGPSQNTRFIISDGMTIQNTKVNDNFRVVVNSSTSQLIAIDAITVKTESQNIGIFQSNPQYTLDVGGDIRVSGNLTVEGNTVIVEADTLRITDKNIELGVTNTPDYTTASGGGITLKSTQDKTLLWQPGPVSSEDTDGYWSLSEHVNLFANKQYRIDNQPILSSSRLFDSVTTATGLTRVGTLSELTVDTIVIDSSTIGRTGANQGLTINANTGDISVTNSKITLLAAPTGPADATTKNYVDRQDVLDPIVMSMDVTGWIQPFTVNNNIIPLLEQLYPASVFANGKQARILTFYYEEQSVTGINIAGSSNKTFVSVNAAAGGTVNVLQDVGLPTNATGTYTPTVTREVRVYEINNGAWDVQ